MESYKIPTRREFLPRVTVKRLEDMREKEPKERYKRHFDAAIMRKDGKTVGEIADDIGVHPLTIMNWLRRMVANGGLGKGYKVRQGILPKFNPKQLKQLERAMEKPPRRYGLDSETWTAKTVAQYALKRFGIEVTAPSMRRILTRTNTVWPGSAAAILARKRGEPYP